MDQRQSVLDHRICDGIQDCPGGEDENGTLKECKKQEAKTEAGCCKYLKAMDRNEIINCEAQVFKVNWGDRIVHKFSAIIFGLSGILYDRT